MAAFGATLPEGSPWLEVALPVGISFYTLQSLSYTFDVYRRVQTPTRSALDFALYVSFFPQLVAGPIVRARELLPQLAGRRETVALDVQEGFARIAVGFVKKVVFADTLALYTDRVFDAPALFSGPEVVLALWAFSYQIYFDFSGYTDIAIGLARLFGVRLPENFDRPYVATSIREYWQRWHISLSTWLRDYLYVSLGGNRKSRGRTLLNLFLTMLIGGLWHGAGAVPQAPDQHGQEEVQQGAPAALPVPAQRDVEVVAQPRREADVPALPVLANAGGDVGPVEVLGQADPEQARQTDGDVGVAGEVEVDLVAEGPEREHHLGPGEERGRVEDAIGVERERVGEDDLLHEPDGDAREPLLHVQGDGLATPGELGQQLAGAHDRSRHELREEGDVEREVEGAPGRRLHAAVDVEGVGEALQRVEGDADRQRHLEPGRSLGQRGAERGHHALGEEAAVLEEAEQAQVGGEARRQQGPPGAARARLASKTSGLVPLTFSNALRA